LLLVRWYYRTLPGYGAWKIFTKDQLTSHNPGTEPTVKDLRRGKHTIEIQLQDSREDEEEAVATTNKTTLSGTDGPKRCGNFSSGS